MLYIDLNVFSDQALFMFWKPHLENAINLPKLQRDLKEKQDAALVLAKRLNVANTRMVRLKRMLPVDFSKPLSVDRKARVYKALLEYEGGVLVDQVKMGIAANKKKGRPVGYKTDAARETMRNGGRKMLEIWRETGDLETMMQCAGTASGQEMMEKEMEVVGGRKTRGWHVYTV
jgi:hypothetical protein